MPAPPPHPLATPPNAEAAAGWRLEDAPESLRFLVRHAAAASALPPEQRRKRIERALAAVAGDAALLPPWARRTRPEGYTRHLLHADPLGRYVILALAWAPGQFSPVHGHHAWCGYAVLGGCLHETLYRYDGKAGLALPESGAAVGPGTTRFAHAGIGAVHKLGNAGDNDAWSLHIYGVAGANLAAGINLVVPAAATTSLQQKIPTSLAEQVQ